jgi:hypothetical protein
MSAWKGTLVSFLMIVAACGSAQSDVASDAGVRDARADSGGTGGIAGGGGSSGSGGMQPSACTPNDSACYPSGDPSGPGSECLAQRDNSRENRVQTRGVWVRDLLSLRSTGDTAYDILRLRSQIPWPACGAQNGTGGFIHLFDWDRSNPDPLAQMVRTGYATYHASPAPGPSPVDLVRDGLCMAESERTAEDDPFGGLALPSGMGLPYPWRVRPIVSRRVAADFDPRAFSPDQIPEGEGRVFIDETSAYVHAYAPLAWIIVLDSRSRGIGIPIRRLEIKMQFNDGTFNCVGRHRAEALEPSRNCDSPSPANPTWGCKDDRDCPPAAFGDPSGVKGPGAGPTVATGYHLIVDLERVYSQALAATLCVTWPGIPIADQVAAGWAARTSNGSANCRGGSRWDPSLPNDAGLPMGDWCSATNSPATATCHDAYAYQVFGAEQAFKIKDGTCPLGTL